MFNTNTDGPTGEIAMNTYSTPAYPSNASVSSAVTMLVSAWFLLASGAILTDQHSGATIVPEAHFSIVVEARRNTAS
jgi:hypothetical protein